ncbi:hypothetical protein DFH27DRAFT_533987 [Peziza echinospora]|nr:hypothetical protein DFH27DRAFT_533987 [Peziza echinospora]
MAHSGNYYNHPAPPVQYSPATGVPPFVNEHTPILPAGSGGSSGGPAGGSYFYGTPGGYPPPPQQQHGQHQYQQQPPPYNPQTSYSTPPVYYYPPHSETPLGPQPGLPVTPYGYGPIPPNPSGAPHRHRHSPPAFTYVITGILHFARHTRLWRPFLIRLPKLLILSFIILVFLFVFTYLPQVAILLFFHGPLAWINAFFMVLSEAAALISIIAEAWLVEDGLVDTFDAVLLDNGLHRLVSTARELLPGRTSVDQLGKYTKSPYLRFSLSTTLKFLACLPLNFVPLVGPGLYILGVGYLQGPLCHYRYFQLQGWGKEMAKEWQREKLWAYLTFGSLHMTLQMVPVLNILLLFTTATGAGLWTVEIERRMRDEGTEEERLCHRF